MPNKQTPLNLSAIITTVNSAISLYVNSERKGDYDRLNSILLKIQHILEPYVWLDMNSGEGIDYKIHVPKMEQMINWINEFEIHATLKHWHYQKHDESSELDHIIRESERFLFFIEKETDTNWRN